jgi:hypothetical protein
MLGLSALGDISDIQAKLGVPKTNEWDRSTLAAISTYQGRQGGELEMHITGSPDPATLINLGYYNPVDELPRRYASFLEGSTDQPSTLGRDLATLSNQVPQWIWIVSGIGMLGVGYYIYRRNKKGAPS